MYENGTRYPPRHARTCNVRTLYGPYKPNRSVSLRITQRYRVQPGRAWEVFQRPGRAWEVLSHDRRHPYIWYRRGWTTSIHNIVADLS